MTSYINSNQPQLRQQLQHHKMMRSQHPHHSSHHIHPHQPLQGHPHQSHQSHQSQQQHYHHYFSQAPNQRMPASSTMNVTLGDVHHCDDGKKYIVDDETRSSCEVDVYQVDSAARTISTTHDSVNINGLIPVEQPHLVDIYVTGTQLNPIALDVGQSAKTVQLVPLSTSCAAHGMSRGFNSSIHGRSQSQCSEVVAFVCVAITTDNTLVAFSVALARSPGGTDGFKLTESIQIVGTRSSTVELASDGRAVATVVEDPTLGQCLILALTQNHDSGSIPSAQIKHIGSQLPVHAVFRFGGHEVRQPIKRLEMMQNSGMQSIVDMQFCELEATKGLVLLTPSKLVILRVPSISTWDETMNDVMGAIPPINLPYCDKDEFYRHESMRLFKLQAGIKVNDKDNQHQPVLSRFAIITRIPPQASQPIDENDAWPSPISHTNERESKSKSPTEITATLPPNWGEVQTMNAIARARQATAATHTRSGSPTGESRTPLTPISERRRHFLNGHSINGSLDMQAFESPATEVLDMSGRYVPRSSPRRRAGSNEMSLEGLQIITDTSLIDKTPLGKPKYSRQSSIGSFKMMYNSCIEEEGQEAHLVLVTLQKVSRTSNEVTSAICIANLPTDLSLTDSMDIKLSSHKPITTSPTNQSNMSDFFMISPSFTNMPGNKFMFSPSPAKHMTPRPAPQQNAEQSFDVVVATSESSSSSSSSSRVSIMSLAFAHGILTSNNNLKTYDLGDFLPNSNSDNDSDNNSSSDSGLDVRGLDLSHTKNGMDLIARVQTSCAQRETFVRLELMSLVETATALRTVLATQPQQRPDATMMEALMRFEERVMNRLDTMEQILRDNNARLANIEQAMGK